MHFPSSLIHTPRPLPIWRRLGTTTQIPRLGTWRSRGRCRLRSSCSHRRRGHSTPARVRTHWHYWRAHCNGQSSMQRATQQCLTSNRSRVRGGRGTPRRMRANSVECWRQGVRCTPQRRRLRELLAAAKRCRWPINGIEPQAELGDRVLASSLPEARRRAAIRRSETSITTTAIALRLRFVRATPMSPLRMSSSGSSSTRTRATPPRKASTAQFPRRTYSPHGGN